MNIKFSTHLLPIEVAALEFWIHKIQILDPSLPSVYPKIIILICPSAP